MVDQVYIWKPVTWLTIVSNINHLIKNKAWGFCVVFAEGCKLEAELAKAALRITCSGIGKAALRIACICLNQADHQHYHGVYVYSEFRFVFNTAPRSSIRRWITFLFPPDVMSTLKLLNLLPYFFERELFVCMMNFQEAWSHQPLVQVNFHT